jgi:hypothetical protein
MQKTQYTVFSLQRPIALCCSASRPKLHEAYNQSVQNLEILNLEVVGKHCAFNSYLAHHMV